MQAFFDFAGAHPIVTVLLAVVIAGTPVQIIRELRRPRDKYKPR